MVVVRGRTVGGAVFENVRHRSGLRATGQRVGRRVVVIVRNVFRDADFAVVKFV